MFCTHPFVYILSIYLRSRFYTSCLCRRVVYYSLAVVFTRFQREFDTPMFYPIAPMCLI